MSCQKLAVWIPFLLGASTVIAGVPSIYWTNQGARKVSRADLDGTNVERIAHNSFDPSRDIGFAIASATGNVYWIGAHGIYRAKLDGANREILVETIGIEGAFVLDLAVLPDTDKLVWAEEIDGTRSLHSARLDGTGGVTIGPLGEDSHGLTPDDQAGTVYWAEADTIRRYVFKSGLFETLIDLDGPDVESFTFDATANVMCWIAAQELWCGDLTGGLPQRLASELHWWTSNPALDAAGGYVYWGVPTERTIHRAAIDGSSANVIVNDSGLSWPREIHLDLAKNKILWAGTTTIIQANLDGSQVETVATIDTTFDYSPQILRFSVETLAGKVYWYVIDINCSSRSGLTSIERVNSDGTDREVVVQTQVSKPSAIALDRATGKLYWSNAAQEFCLTGTIQRANPDGSNSERIIPPTPAPRAFALDVTNGRIYWANGWAIHVADTDGFNQEEILSADGGHAAIAFDSAARKLYWTDFRGCEIRRADLDGSHDELVVSTTSCSVPYNPHGLALERGRVYWTEGSSIWRANIDGTGIESILTMPGRWVFGLAIDPVADRLYWSYIEHNPRRDGIQSANLDGSSVEEFASFTWNGSFDEFQDPYGLAIDPCGREGPVGLLDHPLYVACLFGPHDFAVGECNCADITGDWRVDLLDFAVYQRAFSSR